MSISPERIMRAVAEAQRAVADLGEDADDQALQAAVQAAGGDALRILDRLVETSIADRLLAEQGQARVERLEQRAETARELVYRMLDAMGLATVERPLFTASIVEGPKRLVVVDEAQVPDIYKRATVSIDKNAIKRVLAKLPPNESIPGCTLNNGAPVLRVTVR